MIDPTKPALLPGIQAALATIRQMVRPGLGHRHVDGWHIYEAVLKKAVQIEKIEAQTTGDKTSAKLAFDPTRPFKTRDGRPVTEFRSSPVLVGKWIGSVEGVGQLSWFPDGTRITLGKSDLDLVNDSASVEPSGDPVPAGEWAFDATKPAWTQDGRPVDLDPVRPGAAYISGHVVKRMLDSRNYRSWAPDGWSALGPDHSLTNTPPSKEVCPVTNKTSAEVMRLTAFIAQQFGDGGAVRNAVLEEREACAQETDYEAARCQRNADQERKGTRSHNTWSAYAQIWREASDAIRARSNRPMLTSKHKVDPAPAFSGTQHEKIK